MSNILPTPQMTCTRHEDSTTLRVQPCRTAAVGYITSVRVASPRNAAASCFCRSLSSVTPPYRIFLLCCRCVGVLRSCRPAAVRPPSSSSLQLFFFFLHFYFPASGQAVVTGVVPFSPGSCHQFLSRIGFSNPTARRFFIECC